MSTPTLDPEIDEAVQEIPGEDELEDYFTELEDGTDDPEISPPSTADLLRRYYLIKRPVRVDDEPEEGSAAAA